MDLEVLRSQTVWHQLEQCNFSRSDLGTVLFARKARLPPRMPAGDSLRIAPNVRHWRGAPSSTLMPHTAVTIGGTDFYEALQRSSTPRQTALRSFPESTAGLGHRKVEGRADGQFPEHQVASVRSAKDGTDRSVSGRLDGHDAEKWC